ncbi:E3 ubiquitin-protein ligase Bre1 [Astathelohania contejeani]|uniref:E3 ubiquitin protein ligase n=1 Tax=Astathelohania contejeani TaxID=164912 RepID=A0ABQ7HWV2_9MICR|nr:E3 ubiquitin-protein ligase Bre1 [Thelohania contejeani]
MAKKRKTEELIKTEKIQKTLRELLLQQNIIAYQRGAIYRQMNDYKRRYQNAQKSNEKICAENDAYQKQICLLNNNITKENEVNGCEDAFKTLHDKIKELWIEINEKDEKIFALEKMVDKYESIDVPTPESTEKVTSAIDNQEDVINAYRKEYEKYFERLRKEIADSKTKEEKVISIDSGWETKFKNLEILYYMLEKDNTELTKLNLQERTKFIKSMEYYEELIEKNKHTNIDRIKGLEEENEKLKIEIKKYELENTKLKEIEEIHINEKKYLKDTIGKSSRTITYNIDTQSDNILLLEIQKLSSSYDSILADNRKLMSQIENSNIKIIDNIREITKLSNENFELEKRADYYLKEKEFLKSKHKELESFNLQLEKEIKNYKKEMEVLNNKYMERKSASEYHKRKYIQCQNDYNLIKEEKELLKKKESELKSKLAEEIKKSEDARLELGFIKTDLEGHKKMLAYFMKGESIGLISDLEKYRKLLRCTVCDENYKDTVIGKCMHVFCRACIDKRLELRNRKCPSCGELFCANEVKKIFL